ncbi:MAG: hypothetical protein WC560_08700 [Syntrophales bacterium]
MKNIPETWKKGAIIGGSILLLVSLAGVFYIPRIREMIRIKAEIAQTEKEIRRIEIMGRDFTPSSQEAERWKNVALTFHSLIPPEKDVPGLMYELAGLAKKCNILDISLKEESGGKNVSEGRRPVSPEPSVKSEIIPGEGVGHFSIRLYFHSEYRDMALFLKEIQNIRRLLLLESLVIKRGFPLISVELMVKAYYGTK